MPFQFAQNLQGVGAVKGDTVCTGDSQRLAVGRPDQIANPAASCLRQFAQVEDVLGGDEYVCQEIPFESLL